MVDEVDEYSYNYSLYYPQDNQLCLSIYIPIYSVFIIYFLILISELIYYCYIIMFIYGTWYLVYIHFESNIYLIKHLFRINNQ